MCVQIGRVNFCLMCLRAEDGAKKKPHKPGAWHGEMQQSELNMQRENTRRFLIDVDIWRA